MVDVFRRTAWLLIPLLVCVCGREGQGKNTAPRTAPKAAAVTFVVAAPDGRRLPAGIAVYEAGKAGPARWEGLAGEACKLPPNRYDVLVEYYGQQYWRRGEDLAGGEVTIRLPMATFTMAARSSRGDALAGKVALFPAGRRAGAPAMEGGTSEPLAVLAGVYDVRVNVQGREKWLEGVALEEGDEREETLVEPVGFLVVEAADQNGAPLPADVWIYDAAGEDLPVAASRAGERRALVPGRYNVAVRWRETRDFSAGVAVRENETTWERFTFWQEENR